LKADGSSSGSGRKVTKIDQGRLKAQVSDRLVRDMGYADKLFQIDFTLNRKTNLAHRVQIRCRRMGEDSGRDQLVRIANYIEMIRDHIRATARKATPQEIERIRLILSNRSRLSGRACRELCQSSPNDYSEV
jgi:hypothetical protein